MWFSRKRFLQIFSCFFIGLNILSLALYHTPAAALYRLNLSNADLRGRDFSQTKKLNWAKLSGALLDDADLRGADLSHALGLTLDQLALAQRDENTILPDYIRQEIAAAAAQRAETIQSGEYWDESRSTATERVIDLQADVLFESGSAQIPPEAIPLLERLATTIQKSESGMVQLNGHTDSRGSVGNNQELSKRRANAVKEWLSAYGGIRAERLKTEGYGSNLPVSSNTDPQGRRKNRRVEIRIPQPAKLASNIRSG